MRLQLQLLRHAKSSWDSPGLTDHQRPLNARGRKAAPRIAGTSSVSAQYPVRCVMSFTGSAETAGVIRSHPAVAQRSVRCNIEADSLNAAILGPDVDLTSVETPRGDWREAAVAFPA